jgi:hypothetical protein
MAGPAERFHRVSICLDLGGHRCRGLAAAPGTVLLLSGCQASLGTGTVVPAVLLNAAAVGGPPCQPFLAFGKGGGTCSYRCREVCAGRLGFQVSCCGMCSYVSNLLGLACSCVSSLLSSFFWSKKFQFKATFSRGLASDSTLMLCSSVGNRYGSGIIFLAFGLTADCCLSSDLMIGEMKLISHVR